MGTTLSDLRPPDGAKKRRKRVGRGVGSGRGVTCGRGTKGQKSRSGSGRKPWFEGGQMPLQRRLPKRGFVNIFRVEYSHVNLDRLGVAFEADALVDAGALADKGLVPRKASRVKILARGDIGHPLTVRVQAFSASARAKIEAAGGNAEVVPPRSRLQVCVGLDDAKDKAPGGEKALAAATPEAGPEAE